MRSRHLLVAAALLTVAACGQAGAQATGGVPSRTATGASAAQLSGEVTVFAAASLTDAFEEIGAAFEAEHPDVTVTHNFAGSQQLATQILEGAPADVFASANQMQMDTAAERLSGRPRTFTRNRLAIAVEPTNPKHIAGLSDLGRDDVTVVLAAEEVPAGQYAVEALEEAGVDVQPVSLETDVRAVSTKVSLGEADAGVVYESDIVAAGDSVERVAIADDQNVVATYPIATVADAPNPAAADALVAFVLSEEGRATLERFGFSPP